MKYEALVLTKQLDLIQESGFFLALLDASVHDDLLE